MAKRNAVLCPASLPTKEPDPEAVPDEPGNSHSWVPSVVVAPSSAVKLDVEGVVVCEDQRVVHVVGTCGPPVSRSAHWVGPPIVTDEMLRRPRCAVDSDLEHPEDASRSVTWIVTPLGTLTRIGGEKLIRPLTSAQVIEPPRAT